MSIGILNRVGMYISTTGQGTVTADTLISNKFFTPSEAGAENGRQYYWLLEEGNDFEIFIGTYTSSGTTVSRDTVIKSKIAGTAGTTKLTLAGNATLRSVSPADVFFGRESIYVDARGMKKRTTNGPADDALETSTNKVMLDGLGFDASTIEYAQFRWRMPKMWNEGTVTFIPVWRHLATTTNFKVSWGLQAVALSNDDAGDDAFGTAQYSNDEGGTTADVYVGPESSAITIAGSPAAEDFVVFQVFRKADDGTNDTLAVDAVLLGIVVFINTHSSTDA